MGRPAGRLTACAVIAKIMNRPTSPDSAASFCSLVTPVSHSRVVRLSEPSSSSCA